MIDFLLSLLGGLAARFFYESLFFVIGFIAGALMFRNNPVTGESYAQKFIAFVGSVVKWIGNLRNKAN
jgi:hypothetical protein